MKIILIAKKRKPNVTKVISHLKKHCSKFYFFDSENTNFKFSKIMKIKPDYLISYISDTIIPAKVLKRTKFFNINFHPGPPNYPGIGCFNFALYNDEKTYGCTAHLMEPSVDTGQIINVKNFKISKSDSVVSLSQKTYEAMFSQFKFIHKFFIKNQKFFFSETKWLKKPYKRKELEKLCKIETKMSRKEILKRIKSTYFPGKPSANITIKGIKFSYIP